MNFQQPSKAYQVAIPALDQNPVNFKFTSTLPPGEFDFTFKWFLEQWNVWVTLPSGEIREASGYANTLSWTGFKDYYLAMVTSLSNIGQNDLSNVALVVYQV